MGRPPDHDEDMAKNGAKSLYIVIIVLVALALIVGVGLHIPRE